MQVPLKMTAEEAVMLDRLFRGGPMQTSGHGTARGLVEKNLARWADSTGTLEITEDGRNSACVYQIG